MKQTDEKIYLANRDIFEQPVGGSSVENFDWDIQRNDCFYRKRGNVQKLFPLSVRNAKVKVNNDLIIR